MPTTPKSDAKRPSAFGYNLLRLRTARGLTQGELSEKSGVSRVTISRLESGKHEGPEAKTVDAFASALDVSPEDLWRSPEQSQPRTGPVSEAPASMPPSAPMTLEQFLARNGRRLTGHEREILQRLGRTRPGAVHEWTEDDWLQLARVIREEFPPDLD